MRALLLILLFANAAFFAWSRWIAAPLEPGATPPPPAPQLVLAREAPAPAAAPVAPAAEAPSSCVSIGPFLDLTEAASAATRLRELGFGPRQRVSDGAVWAGWWVALACRAVAGSPCSLCRTSPSRLAMVGPKRAASALAASSEAGDGATGDAIRCSSSRRACVYSTVGRRRRSR